MWKKSLGALSLAACLTACGSKEESTAAASPPTAGATEALAAFFTADAVASGAEIHQARTTAKPGDEIVLNGRVMGRLQPFVDGRAAFVLGDDALLTPCNEVPDDPCTTPWDVCCDSAEAKRDGTATIQIVGDDGRVLPHGIRGVGGLVELSRVTVQGIVAEGSSAEALMVNAQRIYVHP